MRIRRGDITYSMGSTNHIPHEEGDTTPSLLAHHGNGYTILSLDRPGRLTSTDAEDLRNQIMELYRPGQRVIFDLKNLELIDSAALSVLIHIRKRIAETKGSFELAEVGEPVRKLLEITRLHRVFKIHPSVESALRSLRAESGGNSTRRSTETLRLRVRHTTRFSHIRVDYPDSLVAANCIEIRNRVRGCLQKRDVVILNLNRVRNIDSAGIATLVSLKEYSRKLQKQILLVSDNALLNRLLRSYRIHRLFPVYQTDEEAIRSLDSQEEKRSREPNDQSGEVSARQPEVIQRQSDSP